MSLAQRMDSVDGMLRHLSSVPAEHVADVAFYIMQHCTSGSHSVTICKVCEWFKVPCSARFSGGQMPLFFALMKAFAP